MKLYIYNNLGNVTTNWHSEGGLVIVTARHPQDVVSEQLPSKSIYHHDTKTWTEQRDEDYEAPKLNEPIAIYDVAETQERIFVFPDSGCC